MAQTLHANTETPFPYADTDIVIGVSATDADRGFYSVLPAPAFPPELDSSLATAVNMGIYTEGVRVAKNAANKAQREQKDVGSAVASAIGGFKIDPDPTVNTVGAERVKIATKMVTAALESRGMSTAKKNVDANLAGFLTRRRAEIDAALLAHIRAGYAVNKKNMSGGTVATGTLVEDL